MSLNTFDLTTLAPPTRTVTGQQRRLRLCLGRRRSTWRSIDLRADVLELILLLEPTRPTIQLRAQVQARRHRHGLRGQRDLARPHPEPVRHGRDTTACCAWPRPRAGCPSPTVSSYLTTYGEQAGEAHAAWPGRRYRAHGGHPLGALRRQSRLRGHLQEDRSALRLRPDRPDEADARWASCRSPASRPTCSRSTRRTCWPSASPPTTTGSFAYFNGIQIQIFDVTELPNPKLRGRRSSARAARTRRRLTNHLAFNYFAPKKMLALPITVCEGGGNGSYGTNLTFAGLMAFDISLETGITEHGRLPFVDAGTVDRRRQLRQVVDRLEVAGQAQHLHGRLRLRPERRAAAGRRRCPR